MHQCTIFFSDPQQIHANIIINFCKYLQGTRDQSIIIDPEKYHQLEVHANADFIGNYNKINAPFYTRNYKSHLVFFIMFCDFPIIWTYKLQTLVSLSSCESGYYALRKAFIEAVPAMELLKDINDNVFL